MPARWKRGSDDKKVFLTNIFEAIGKGDLESVDVMLATSESPLTILRSKDPQGLTPLRKAVVLNKIEICQKLVEYGAEPSVVDPIGKTVLHRAASVGSIDLMAPLLVSHDSSVNPTDRSGNTPLHYAVKGAHWQAVDWLLFLGADITLKNKEEKTPLEMCPADSPLVEKIKDEAKELKVEQIQLASTYMGRKYMSKLGSDGSVVMLTSDKWPESKQFIMNTRKAAEYCLPPIPLRQDESYYNHANVYRLMYTLHDTHQLVRINFTVFEELTNCELVMKISSKRKYLGEVPVTMSTYLIDEYTNYNATADLELKNQGQFVLVKRPKWYFLFRDEDNIYYNPSQTGIMLLCQEPLRSWPAEFEETRREREKFEADALLEPLTAAIAAKKIEKEKEAAAQKQEEKDKQSAKEEAAAGGVSEAAETENISEYTHNKSMAEQNISNNMNKSLKGGSKDKIGTLSKMKMSKATTLSAPIIDEKPSSEEVSHTPVLLTGQEDDNCEEFYYISRGWGLYVQIRIPIQSQLLLDITDPEEFQDSLFRCWTPFYTLQHSTLRDPAKPFTIQFSKISKYQEDPFVKVGTVLVFVRRSLEPDEVEYPDPDELAEESHIAEDGKSTKIEYWLMREKERWSLLDSGISNLQTRIVCNATMFTTYIAVQLKSGTERWRTEEVGAEDSSEGEEESDEEGEGDDEDKEVEEPDADDGEKKKKKKKKKKQDDVEGSKNDGNSNQNKKEFNKTNNQKSVDTSNNKMFPGTRPDPGLTAEPGAPRPSPQPSSTEFKDMSALSSDSDVSESESGSDESIEEGTGTGQIYDNNNSSIGRVGLDTNNNSSRSERSQDRKSKAASMKTISMISEKYEPQEETLAMKNTKSMPSMLTLGLSAEEKNVNAGMTVTQGNFFSLEPTAAPEDEEDLTTLPEERSLEDLPPVDLDKTGSQVITSNRQALLLDYDFGMPLTFTLSEDIEPDHLFREVALMWRYRNHFLVTICVFTKHRPHEEQSWDLVVEIVASHDLVVRAEMWWFKGYSMIARSKEFPLKSCRNLKFTISSNLIIGGPNGCQPGGTITSDMYFATNKINTINLPVRKFIEPKIGFKKGAAGAAVGGKKKDEHERRKEPELVIVTELFYPNMKNSKEVNNLNVYIDNPGLWADKHERLRDKDGVLLDKLVKYLQDQTEVTDNWWKVWILLGYSESDMEKEKQNNNRIHSTSLLLRRWFGDNLDSTDRGILRIYQVLKWLNVSPDTITDFILILKEYKSEHVKIPDAKFPRYQRFLIHWINDTKMTENNLNNMLEVPVYNPTNEAFLLQLSQLITGVTPEELGATMDVEDNFLYMLNEEQVITDPSYKPFKVLSKARQKNEDIVKYMVLLLEMVKKLNQPKAVGEFFKGESLKWMASFKVNEISKEQKDTNFKLEGLLANYIPQQNNAELEKLAEKKQEPSGTTIETKSTAKKTDDSYGDSSVF